MNKTNTLLLLFLFASLLSCTSQEKSETLETHNSVPRMDVIFDTDANNELDDQHALAYLLFNSNIFNIKGVTVNATFNGGDIQGHLEEADRIMKLCNASSIPLIKGANADFSTIRNELASTNYDGRDAVEFIINEARKSTEDKLIVLAVGKLTNVALAVTKAPDIKSKIRLVWLGSNYPEPGEYNLENDIPSMNYLLDQDIDFELVMVRYGKESGSDAVRVTPEIMNQEMPGAGPEGTTITGRHGGEFSNFGDYSVDLFAHIDLHGDPPARALFDMVAVAVLKNPDWGTRTIIPAPTMESGSWVERPTNPQKVIIWENFNTQAILDDFFDTMNNPAVTY
jgi:inosine-uridine nucleoside N-ribohydrolase